MENMVPETLGTAVFLLTSMVIGGTELVKRLFDRDWRAAVIIVVSTIIGAVGGTLLIPAIGIVGGIVIGLSASGVVTGLQKVGDWNHVLRK